MQKGFSSQWVHLKAAHLNLAGETEEAAARVAMAAVAEVEVVTVVTAVALPAVVKVSAEGPPAMAEEEEVEEAGKEAVTHCRRRGGSRPCWMSLMPCCSRLMCPT